MIIDSVKARIGSNNQFVQTGHMDVALFTDFDPVFEKKPFEIDKFDVVHEFILKLIVKAHFFVSEDMAVDSQLGGGILGRKIAAEIGQIFFDVGVFWGKRFLFEKYVAVEFDVSCVIPIVIRR